MSKFNRYLFLKKMYPDYLILVLDDKNKKIKYYTYEMDSNILVYINFKNNINTIKKKKINFVVIDNMNKLTIDSYNDNKYKYFVYLISMNEILKSLQVNLIGSI